MAHPGEKFRILPTPTGHALVVAVYPQEILPPVGQVASTGMVDASDVVTAHGFLKPGNA